MKNDSYITKLRRMEKQSRGEMSTTTRLSFLDVWRMMEAQYSQWTA